MIRNRQAYKNFCTVELDIQPCAMMYGPVCGTDKISDGYKRLLNSAMCSNPTGRTIVDHVTALVCRISRDVVGDWSVVTGLMSKM